MKKLTSLLCLLLISCGTTTPAIAVASLGIAGAGLATYCAVGGNGCSPALVAYSNLTIVEASADASILESGQTTASQISGMVINLNMAINQGHALVGLTPGQQEEVAAIIAAATSVVTLVEALTPSAPSAVVKLPALSDKDHAKITEMRARIQAVK